MHRQSPKRQTKPKHSKPRQLQPLPSQRLTPGRTKRPSPRRRSRRRAFFPLSLSPHVPLFLPFVPPCLPPPPNEPTAPPAPSMSLRRAMESGTLSPATTRRGHQSLERQRRVPHARPQSPLAVPSDGLVAPAASVIHCIKRHQPRALRLVTHVFKGLGSPPAPGSPLRMRFAASSQRRARPALPLLHLGCFTSKHAHASVGMAPGGSGGRGRALALVAVVRGAGRWRSRL